MFIPLHDGVKLLFVRRPFSTLALMVINFSLFVYTSLFAVAPGEGVNLSFGLIPAVLTGHATLDPQLQIVPAFITPLTSIFLHAGFWHFAANMLFLWVFGDNVEDAMGSMRFLVFYLACGIVAGLGYVLIAPQSQSHLIGASGAVSGVASAYVLLYPRARIVGLLLNWIPLAIPALLAIGMWVAFQIVAALISADTSVGWWAHVGGIVAGALLLPLMKRREVPLFGARTS